MQKSRQDLLEIFQAGINAVKPDKALLKHMRLLDETLYIDGNVIEFGKGKIRVVGAGKGTAPLALAIEQLLGERISEGLIVVKDGHSLSLKHCQTIEASHPVPDKRGQAGAEKILEIAAKSRPGDLLVALFTGGASALLPAAASDLDLAAIREATDKLLASGASIEEINAVRKHLSRISGGQLAKAANGAKILGVIVSDVIGDDLEAIASGPTAGDSSTYNDCLKIIEKYNLKNIMPAKVMEHLQAGAMGEMPETPKPGEKFFANVHNVIIASNIQALEAAAAKAEKLGYVVEMDKEPMRGEAQKAANKLVRRAEEIAAGMQYGSKRICLIAGGETTVSISGNGKGGRNQEMALATSIAIENNDRIAALFAGTDGTDGPTDAAGGFAFGDSVKRIGGLARAKEFLDENDSYNALSASGDILKTGPTRTNVMDMAIVLIQPPLAESPKAEAN